MTRPPRPTETTRTAELLGRSGATPGYVLGVLDAVVNAGAGLSPAEARALRDALDRAGRT